MPKLRNGDVELFYAERGDPEGRPVVLLHGLFHSRRMFDRLAERLPERRMLLLDLRGHGRSTRPQQREAYDWSLMASDVAALLDHLGLERAVVGGLSLGANATLAFAGAHGERLAAAIVEMPVLDEGRAAAERLFRPMARALEVGGFAIAPGRRLTAPLRRLGVPEVATAADLLSLEPRAGAALLRALLDDHGTATAGVDALAGLGVPTLVLGHRGDALHPLADAESVARRVPGAELEVLPSIAELRVRPRRYAAIVGRFLDDLPAA